MGVVKISPALEAVMVGDSESGSLLLIGNETSVIGTEKYADSIALRVSGNWRFKLKSVDPSSHKANPFDVSSGLIVLLPEGGFFVSSQGTDPFRNALLVNLDTLDLVPLHGAVPDTCYPTD